MKSLPKLCLDARKEIPKGPMAPVEKLKFPLKGNTLLAYSYNITSNDDKQLIEDLQNNITAALGKTKGQIEGLQINLQSVIPPNDVTHKITAPSESDTKIYELGQRLKVFRSAVDKRVNLWQSPKASMGS
ncbi:hypothetical protein G6011_02968 [Alternaria panax]|uniref:Uncharacterized protein n=1 Tax=Alternaria panax TaxID=48097 RepID=A0AAD4FAD4_9PLEO|nr:hypothetical protein G6011_02968 [Alternaria panax]